MTTAHVIQTASEYLDAIVRRNRAPMETSDFEPDWADQPRRYNVYPGIRPIPLPSVEVPLADLDTALAGQPRGGGVLTLGMLGEMLRESYGHGGRRLRVTANGDARILPRYAHARWSRGTASGGGLYPLEIYWACGASGPMLPGVYNYSAPHHAMQRLVVGDVTGRIRRAIGPVEAAHAGDQFLLVTNRFWKNAFKYRNFCYHAVTMDVGTALATWQLWSRAAGVSLRPLLTFDEIALNELLGVRTHEESVFAVVPLPWAAAPSPDRPQGTDTARVAVRPVERSRTVVRYPTVERVHASTVNDVGTDVGDALPELLDAARPVVPAGDAIGLGDPRPLTATVRDALRDRRSSFGKFSAHERLGREDLGAVLRAGTAGARFASNITRPDGTPELTRLTVFANHVDRVPPGVYDYDDSRNALMRRESGDVGAFLQRNYFLRNYNLEQAAAVVAVLARPHAAMSAVGQRGYRFVNTEVGAVAQALYTAAAAAGLGCGAALGFDNVSYVERLGDSTGEWPLLIVMLGHERRRAPDFHFQLS